MPQGNEKRKNERRRNGNGGGEKGKPPDAAVQNPKNDRATEKDTATGDS